MSVNSSDLGGMPRTHELKVWPLYFDALESGVKSFEFRRDDREPAFEVGDTLHLREFNAVLGRYTGHECRRRVTYVARGGVIPEGFCVMSLEASSHSFREDGSDADLTEIANRLKGLASRTGVVGEAAQLRDDADKLMRLAVSRSLSERPEARAITINGRAHTTGAVSLHYEDIVKLAGLEDRPDVLWTIVVHFPYTSTAKDCSIARGECVFVESGMSITCVDTSRA